MRVIAGEWRGTRLASPEGRDVRPTTDKVKEAMFGSLQFSLPGARVLDMFGGSGALGIEAASRGAADVWILEKDGRARRTIQENLARVGSPEGVRLVGGSFQQVLPRLAEEGAGPFDIVLMDPPYDAGLYAPALRLLADRGLVRDGALAVMESDRAVEIPADAFEGAPLAFEEKRTRRYGTMLLTYGRFQDA